MVRLSKEVKKNTKRKGEFIFHSELDKAKRFPEPPEFTAKEMGKDICKLEFKRSRKKKRICKSGVKSAYKTEIKGIRKTIKDESGKPSLSVRAKGKLKILKKKITNIERREEAESFN